MATIFQSTIGMVIIQGAVGIFLPWNSHPWKCAALLFAVGMAWQCLDLKEASDDRENG